MGGKAAMFFAEKHPQKIDNLIILDISPRNYRYLTENEPNIIYHLNIISIIKNLNLDLYSTYSEINSQIETNDKNIKNLILKNLKKTKGKFSWKMNVEAISNNLNNIFDGLNPDNYINKKIPVKSLFIKASNSEYIDNNDKKLINFIFSNASIIDIENVGHWLHIEQPGKLQSLILDFLKMD
jgi:pimeloyl-ACP methyl ester carboxylesterase